MLVLSRKNREALVVGGGGDFESVVKITVLEVAPGKVKLGIEADGDVPVNRLEVWERMCAKGEAGRPGSPPVRSG